MTLKEVTNERTNSPVFELIMRIDAVFGFGTRRFPAESVVNPVRVVGMGKLNLCTSFPSAIEYVLMFCSS